VDGFDQDKTTSKANHSVVALVGILATHGDTLKALQLAHGLLDPGSSFVKQLQKKAGAVFRV